MFQLAQIAASALLIRPRCTPRPRLHSWVHSSPPRHYCSGCFRRWLSLRALRNWQLPSRHLPGERLHRNRDRRPWPALRRRWTLRRSWCARRSCATSAQRSRREQLRSEARRDATAPHRPAQARGREAPWPRPTSPRLGLTGPHAAKAQLAATFVTRGQLRWVPPRRSRMDAPKERAARMGPARCSRIEPTWAGTRPAGRPSTGTHPRSPRGARTKSAIRRRSRPRTDVRTGPRPPYR